VGPLVVGAKRGSAIEIRFKKKSEYEHRFRGRTNTVFKPSGGSSQRAPVPDRARLPRASPSRSTNPAPFPAVTSQREGRNRARQSSGWSAKRVCLPRRAPSVAALHIEWARVKPGQLVRSARLTFAKKRADCVRASHHHDPASRLGQAARLQLLLPQSVPGSTVEQPRPVSPGRWAVVPTAEPHPDIPAHPRHDPFGCKPPARRNVADA